METAIDRDIAARKVQQIKVMIGGAIASLNEKGGILQQDEIIDELGLTLEALQSLTQAVIDDISGVQIDRNL